ncbi:MAG: hypothetical protein ABFS38_11255 [Bacteroidota bacterium]
MNIILQSRQGGACLLSGRLGNEMAWENNSISEKDMGQWEPTFDSELWKEKQELHLYGQYVQQVSGDPNNVSSVPTMVSVFEVQLDYKIKSDQNI